MGQHVFHYELQVRWSDSDRPGHVNNTRFVEYLQEARANFITHCFREGGAGVEPAGTTREKAGVEPAGTTKDGAGVEPAGGVKSHSFVRGATVVRQITVDFLHPIYDGSGPLDIAVDVRRIGTTSFAVGHTVTDTDGVVCAHAEALMVAFDLTTESSRPLTSAERAALEKYLASESAVS